MNSVARGAVAVVLLICSNAFMNAAWYLHLKFKSWPMFKAIVLSWLIAFCEYCLQVPGNRIGHYSSGGPFTAPQLKTIQECLTLATFAVFSTVVLKEKLHWSDAIAFGLIFSGVVVGMVLKPKSANAHDVAVPPPPVAPAPEPLPPDGATGAVASIEDGVAPSTEAQPGELEAGGKPPQPQQGRKLLELPLLGWLRGSRHSAGSQVSSSAEHVQQLERQAQREEEEGGAQQVQRRGSQEELLPRGSPLRSEGSSAVLLASGANFHLTSSRQGTHHREHQQSEGEGDAVTGISRGGTDAEAGA